MNYNVELRVCAQCGVVYVPKVAPICPVCGASKPAPVA